jgi:hypothetical protein
MVSGSLHQGSSPAFSLVGRFRAQRGRSKELWSIPRGRRGVRAGPVCPRQGWHNFLEFLLSWGRRNSRRLGALAATRNVTWEDCIRRPSYMIMSEIRQMPWSCGSNIVILSISIVDAVATTTIFSKILSTQSSRISLARGVNRRRSDAWRHVV